MNVCNTRKSLRSLTFEKLEPRVVLSSAPIITEFVASNDNSLDDGDGNSSDWIEIYNPTKDVIDLAGWHLTDKANNLDKWTFPSLPQSILSPGEYLIVFASSQETETYIDPEGNLHTDFALSANGEFLGLTDPLENIAWSYAPEFPQQLTDVSYGVNTQIVNLIDDSTTTSAWVPTSDVFDTGASPAWTQIAFDDSSWPQSASGPGVGYDSSIGHSPGPANGIELSDLVGGDLTDPEDDGILTVAFEGGSSSNSPTGEEPAKALDNTDATKWLAFAPSGTYYEIHFTDGLPRIIDGYTITSANDASNRDPYSWTLSGSNDGETFTVVDGRNAQDFEDRFETRLYEFSNTTGYSSYRFDFQTEYGVTGSNMPNSIQMAEIELFSSREFNMDQLVDLDLQSEWEQTRSSIYQRVEFNVVDPSALGALWMDMQFNDGFVAYLNGERIVVENAPENLNWQSLALEEREASDALSPKRFDLSEFHDLLVPGNNVLAFQALNDNDFSSQLLSRPQLTAALLDMSAATEFYYETPTPGAPNGEGRLGFVSTPKFSVPHGFYSNELRLSISNETAGSQIYYTTNGAPPTPDSGLLYTSPIPIDGTMVILAAAFQEGYYDSTIVGSTYVFVHDVVSQSYSSTLATGFPTSWGGVSPDYGMDPDVIGNFDSAGNSLGGDLFGGQYASTIQNDLLAIPTLSIVMETDDLFGPDGIYTQSTNSGVAYERATSVELIYPDGSEGFQVNAGIRIQGGAFRSHDLSKKHSFRLLFKDDYGPTKLEFPLFGDDAVASFDTITLRMESNDGYAWDGAGTHPQYARDAFASRTLAALGQVASHSNRVHLYINGVYWGVYNPTERPDASFAAMYFGGDKDNWDAINDGSPTNGDLDAWNAMVALAQQAGSGTSSERAAAYQRLQGANPDGSNNPAYEDYLDIDNYIDYLLVNFYGGNVDWPHRNWYAVRERGLDSTGFKFVSWDAESTMNLFGSSINTNRLNVNVEAALPYSYLRNNEEFRIQFADHAYRALFNDGALTPDETISRYQSLLTEMENAIVAESARWGDMHRSTPLTKTQWEAEGQSVVDTFLTGRTNVFINQLRSAGLYPSVDAPVFSQQGGQIAAGGINLDITSTSGVIYYTLDGTDPRAMGGDIVGQEYTTPVLVTPGVTVKARALNGGEWSALNEATFEAILLPGDYDGNGTVEQADYLVWKTQFGQEVATPGTGADGNLDGVVSLADYTIWRDNLGATIPFNQPASLQTSPSSPAVTVVTTNDTTSATIAADTNVKDTQVESSAKLPYFILPKATTSRVAGPVKLIKDSLPQSWSSARAEASLPFWYSNDPQEKQSSKSPEKLADFEGSHGDERYDTSTELRAVEEVFANLATEVIRRW
ncbi:CotH kinase family protein [Aeoliella mucimassa]|uniref:CotH protein n=1 Tax=Aeoliella mucimassa TaxID=2527972 RepID=A0A518AK24_9BACT|nr:CotH kinase family protein [Aeoliella mucimassa]QDU55036.1 CotH protein [Aeoliella mucimassa]